MYRILAIAAVLLTLVLVGCSENPAEPKVQNTNFEVVELLTLGYDSTNSENVKGLHEPTALGTTYAFGVIPWHDNIEGDEDWMAVFYLPYNPGSVYFYGRTRFGYWQNFGPPLSQLHDARWTAQGFRVMIFMGDKVTLACGSAPGSYRLQY